MGATVRRSRAPFGWMKRRGKMLDLLEAAVRQFRLGMEGGGNDSLARFSNAWAASPPLIEQTLLLDPLRQLLQAQKRGDYLRVADLLEYELAPLLGSPAKQG